MPQQKSLLFGRLLILLILAGCRTSLKQVQVRFEKTGALLVRINEPKIPTTIFNVLQYGAIADGRSDTKTAIDRAIKACKNAGGGKVIFPPGKYLVKGPIHMVSNLELRIETGAELIFAGDSSNYLPVVKSRWEGTIVYNYSPFIYAYQKHNIAITGKGTINGNSKETWNTMDTHPK